MKKKLKPKKSQGGLNAFSDHFIVPWKCLIYKKIFVFHKSKEKRIKNLGEHWNGTIDGHLVPLQIFLLYVVNHLSWDVFWFEIRLKKWMFFWQVHIWDEEPVCLLSSIFIWTKISSQFLKQLTKLNERYIFSVILEISLTE